jgi:hypothetical protein
MRIAMSTIVVGSYNILLYAGALRLLYPAKGYPRWARVVFGKVKLKNINKNYDSALDYHII